jgi:chemotaxis protein methyltransferase CheR
VQNIEFSVEIRQAFTQLISKYTGITIRDRDQATLTEKIFSRMKHLNISLPENYYEILQSSTTLSLREWRNLVVLLTNTDSYFFRDLGQFEVLKKHILPEIIQRNYKHKTIRICSAGCSSGEEPYSLAILLKEIIPDFHQWKCNIFGLDINPVALQKAQTGVYTSWSFRKTNMELMKKYFLQIQSQYFLRRHIRQMVKFLCFNLIKDPLPHSNYQLIDIDLIICRNVFIYFEDSAIAKVLSKFYYTLQPLGYLMTGHNELFNQNLSEFEIKVFPESLVYQRKTEQGIGDWG